jgi:DNA-binding response OmpR family regulator
MPTQAPVVLVVEDESLIAMMIEEALDAAGYAIGGIASSEDEALRLAKRHPPRFAVLDINLGRGGSGLVVGRRLRELGVGLIYASGNCADYLAEMAETGAHGYFNKPYRPDDVPRVLDLLDGRASGDPVHDLPPEFRPLGHPG